MEEVVACSLNLLKGPDGELNFEQVKAAPFSACIYNFDKLNQQLTVTEEIPLEVLVMQAYARKLQSKCSGEFQSNAWGNRFTSAEMFICKMGKRKNTEEKTQTEQCVSRRRKALCFRPLHLPINHEASVYSFSDNTQTHIAKLDDENIDPYAWSAITPLLKKDCHLIDVSNYIPANEKPPELENSLENNNITQFFSTQQIKELLLKQSVSPSEQSNNRVGVVAGINPWAANFVDAFWTSIGPKIITWPDVYLSEKQIPSNKVFVFGNDTYTVLRKINSGSYGSIFLVKQHNLPLSIISLTKQSPLSTKNLNIVKLEMSDYPLDFYHMREVHSRITSAFKQKHLSMDLHSAVCTGLALNYCPFSFACILMPFYPIGLLDYINVNNNISNSIVSINRLSSARNSNSIPPILNRFEDELVIVYMTWELLWLLEGLHTHARVIHGDIKPDNFRINNHFPFIVNSGPKHILDSDTHFSASLSNANEDKVLVIVDFGLCIDLARFPAETVFQIKREPSTNRSFPCIEMLTGMPWSYQLDLFNSAGVVYAMVFKRYMEVECIKGGQWRPKVLPTSSRNFKAISIWRNVVLSLINVKSCAKEDYPDLALLRHDCEKFLIENANEYNSAVKKANQILDFLASI